MDPWGEVEDETAEFSLYGTGDFTGEGQGREVAFEDERQEDPAGEGGEVLYQRAFATFVGARNRLRQKELLQPNVIPNPKGSPPVPGKNPTSRTTGARLRCFVSKHRPSYPAVSSLGYTRFIRIRETASAQSQRTGVLG